MFDETGQPLIDERRWEGEEFVSEFVSGARSYFARADVVEKIAQQASETLAWMRENKQSFTAVGDLRYERWWPMPAEVNDPVLRHAGQKVLVDRAYGHGMMHFLRGLESKRVIAALNKRIINLVLDSMTATVLNQLVIYHFHDQMASGVSLRQLSELFGNGENTKPAKVRDRYLGDLASIGLFKARENEGWDIALGPVAAAYYQHVNAIILDEFTIEYKE